MVLLTAVGPFREYPDLNSLPSRRRLDPVSPYVELIGVILLPTAAGYALLGFFRGIRWAGERDWSRRGAPEPEPIDRLAANLRRLRVQLEDMETRTDLPGKHLRLQALRGAYADALGTACQRLEVSPPLSAASAGSERAYQADIYRVEAQLRQRGLDVREPASH
jgi:hypothetical protein